MWSVMPAMWSVMASNVVSNGPHASRSSQFDNSLVCVKPRRVRQWSLQTNPINIFSIIIVIAISSSSSSCSVTHILPIPGDIWRHGRAFLMVNLFTKSWSRDVGVLSSSICTQPSALWCAGPLLLLQLSHPCTLYGQRKIKRDREERRE